MANRIPRVPVREQDPKVRAANFEEVCYGYNAEEAMLEASRCLHCKNPRCVGACPVNISIPEFISKVATYEEEHEEPNLSELLEEIALIADIDSVSEGEDRTLLMTIHAAKGLEYPVIFYVVLPKLEIES